MRTRRRLTLMLAAIPATLLLAGPTLAEAEGPVPAAEPSGAIPRMLLFAVVAGLSAVIAVIESRS